MSTPSTPASPFVSAYQFVAVRRSRRDQAYVDDESDAPRCFETVVEALRAVTRGGLGLQRRATRVRLAAEQRLAAIAALHQPVAGGGRPRCPRWARLPTMQVLAPAPQRCCLGHGLSMRKPPVPHRQPCLHPAVLCSAVSADIWLAAAAGHQFSRNEGRTTAV